MDIPKVENVSTVLRNVLHVAINVVQKMATIRPFWGPLFTVKGHEVGLAFRVRVNPNIHKAILLVSRVFTLFWVLLFSLFPLKLLKVLAAEIITIFDWVEHQGLFIVVCIMQKIPTHWPVSPSKSHPWKGHWTHVSLTTCPPTPRLAPMWAQYACNA